jgi:hypothetical protein
MRWRPRPRSIRISVVSSCASSCGVSVPRTSASVAKALTIRLTGATTLCACPSVPRHCVRIDRLSLPTGMLMPSCGHSSSPTALTVSYSAASSPGSPQAAIQLAESLTRDSSIGAASKLVIASATAMRPAAGASSAAIGVRSPMAIASPARLEKSASVTAQSATGTCHGPTIWSRCVRPPTVRSPIVIKNRLLATVGCASTPMMACCRSTPVPSKSAKRRAMRVTSRRMRGGLPSSTSIGISTGRAACASAACPSSTTSCRSSVETPTTAYGQRSRSHNWARRGSASGAMAST